VRVKDTNLARRSMDFALVGGPSRTAGSAARPTGQRQPTAAMSETRSRRVPGKPGLSGTAVAPKIKRKK
jgi:hypothetical protein